MNLDISSVQSSSLGYIFKIKARIQLSVLPSYKAQGPIFRLHGPLEGWKNKGTQMYLTILATLAIVKKREPGKASRATVQKSDKLEVWGGGSVCIMFATEAQGPEFNPQNSHKSTRCGGACL